MTFMDRNGLRSVLCCSVGALILVAGCGGEDELLYEEQVGKGESWIINGQLDTTHQAVVAAFTQNSACTGTIVHVNGSNAYVLTAAHCFGSGPIQWVAIGNDYNSSSAVWLEVQDYQVHPQYSPQQLIYDFAILRASGASSATLVIPAMSVSEDNLSQGSPVTHVGYGLTSYPNGSTSKRHYTAGNLSQTTAMQLAYNQPVSGPCQGDSGGPNLANAGGGERVAGVISYGDEGCDQMGVSGRVSYVNSSFIQPFIGQSTSSSSSSSTSTSSGTGGEAGTGGTTSTSSGAGGTGPIDTNWVAGDLDEQKYSGEVVMSTCTAAPGTGRSAWAGGLLTAMLGLLGLFRRRTGEG